jgi:asparagine synthase (glutamine-hydrolysing)
MIAMCGIAGFIRDASSSEERDARTLRRMLTPIAHRGPDHSGIHVNRELALGYVRLAVIDLQGGQQPRVDPVTGDALVFNGEIYGHASLAARLQSMGVQLLDKSDTEVLFRLLQREGVHKTLESVDGMFAFAFYEARSNRLYIARDRFGEKPLYYLQTGQAFVFGSEPSAVFADPAARDLAVDLDAVATYLHFEYLPGTRSVYRDLHKLPPGHLLTFASGRVEISRYWRPAIDDAGFVHASEDEKLATLDALLNDSVKDRLIADVPVGVFLSGGIDSSLIAALVARYSSGLTALTISLPDATYDEGPPARTLANALGLRHRVISVDDEKLQAAFQVIAAKMDEPIADSSLLLTMALCTAARQEVTVALGGDGADELFGGYISFRANHAAPVLALLPRALGRLARRALEGIDHSSYMSTPFLLRQLSQACGLEPARQWTACMAPFADEELARLWRPEAAPALSAHADPITPLLVGRGQKRWSTAELLYVFTQSYLPEDILQKVDRASMYTSLEVRSPYLARKFSEYSLKLPSSDKVNLFASKRLFRKLARRYIPTEIVDRRKHGFAAPIARLLRGKLRVPVGEMILDSHSALREWLQAREIERLWHAHQSGARNHAKKIWTLFCLATALHNSRSRLLQSRASARESADAGVH